MGKSETSQKKQQSRPAFTPEARENQLIALAVDRAEKQLRDGTASSQVITHYLKLGASKEINKLALERERKEMQLIDAKIEGLKSQKNTEKLFTDAITAMKKYSGNGSDEYED